MENVRGILSAAFAEGMACQPSVILFDNIDQLLSPPGEGEVGNLGTYPRIFDRYKLRRRSLIFGETAEISVTKLSCQTFNDLLTQRVPWE